MTSEFTIAVHALVFLNHKGTVFSSEGLAANVCTNAARIRKVMAKLKKADLVKTKEGVDGGYLFHRDSRDVNLSMVAEALDTPFVAASWKSGNPAYGLSHFVRHGGNHGRALWRAEPVLPGIFRESHHCGFGQQNLHGAPKAVTAI